MQKRKDKIEKTKLNARFPHSEARLALVFLDLSSRSRLFFYFLFFLEAVTLSIQSLFLDLQTRLTIQRSKQL